uniref:4-hydroxybenzoate polyprenyltransferase, mitochondrial n=1 Tax=Rhabditophanes sp. KR3021 TaxID=114890 RepID=A0AC35TZP2_9BILA
MWQRSMLDKSSILLRSSLKVSQLSPRFVSISNDGGENKTKSLISYIPKAKDLVELAPNTVKPYLYLMRVDKPIGTWLLYWPCTWSIGLATPAGQLPSLSMLALFGTGALLMRSAGCVINDLWDKDFDKHVERTKTRPLASGQLSDKQAVALLGGLLSGSLAILCQLNVLSMAVGASSMLLVVGYPLAKRYTYWPQLVLGLTFNWGVILGYTAIANDIPLSVVGPCYLAALNWTLVYDTIYALQDKDDDILIGVKSTALKFGEQTKQWLTGFSLLTVSGLTTAGIMANQTWPYYLAVAGTASHLAWQVGTVNINNGDDCWKKFKSNHYLGLLLFMGIVGGTLLKEDKKVNSEVIENDVQNIVD